MCLVRYGDIAYQLLMKPSVKIWFFAILKQKKRRDDLQSTKMRCLEQLSLRPWKNEVLFDYVLTDNWFEAKKNMQFILYIRALLKFALLEKFDESKRRKFDK
jgi:hypothetical protein